MLFFTVDLKLHLFILSKYHAMIDWGFGVTSDITGNLNNVDSNVLFDFFIFTHEIGHSLGSGHTFDDEYDPPIDFCAPCASPGSNVTINELPRNNSATLMVCSNHFF